MSYAIAPTFEGNRMGVRRLRTLSGIRGGFPTLGDIQGDAAVAVGLGLIDQGTANFLITAGATDQDFIDLINGVTDVATLMSKVVGYAPANPIPGAGINPAIAPPPPSIITAPVTPGTVNYSIPAVPQGSTLLYQVAYSQTLLTLANLTLPANSVQAQIQNLLPQYGMSVMSSSITDNGPETFGITFSIRVTGNGFAQLADAQSILHSLMLRIVGNTITSESMSMVAGTGQAFPVNTLPGTSTATNWLNSNWPLLVAGGIGFLVLGIVFEKRV